jgi:hypothetical protein
MPNFRYRTAATTAQQAAKPKNQQAAISVSVAHAIMGCQER